MVYMNLSRLAAQREKSINNGLLRLEKEATRRIDGLIATAERLIETGQGNRLPSFRLDFDRIRSARSAQSCESASFTEASTETAHGSATVSQGVNKSGNSRRGFVLIVFCCQSALTDRAGR